MNLQESDPTFHDIYNPSSRSELCRQLSIHSSTTSGSGKRSLARVSKQSSASNSPHHVQRRRTTANHSTRTHCRTSQDNPYQTREQRLRNYHNSQQSAPFSRPMSWHPGSDTARNLNPQITHGEPALGNTIMGLENLAVDNTPEPFAQQSIHNAFSMGYGFPIKYPNSSHDVAPATLPAYGAPCYASYPLYGVSDHPQCPYIPQVHMHDAHPGITHQIPQQWSQLESEIDDPPAISHAIPQYPLVPAQNPSIAAQKSRVSRKAQITNKKSKELVGMGLYDDKPIDFMSNIGGAFGHDSNRYSLGKGLKLEETWQPPDEDDEDEDEDEDAYSTDDADETEDAPLQAIAVEPPEPQKQYYPAPGDLSNQSFLFDEDEYNFDDPYTNYFTCDQGLHASAATGVSNPHMLEYMWQ